MLKNPPKSPINLSKTFVFLIFAIILIIWLVFTSTSAKLRMLIVSSFYSLIEYTFYVMTIELPNGDTIFKPFDPGCRKPHTVSII